jgi:molybdenum cofactor synthesis domain-containing protein
MSTAIPKGAMPVIGDEILSGRTQDTNTNTVARFLAGLGLDLGEARVVGDEQGAIVAALNALRNTYDFVFTSGGIGPTHDDITADAVAAAFGVGISHHPEAMALLGARYAKGEFNAMRQRMARMPHGATLIPNPVSTAPGFQIGNVFVMAGVPMVLKAMLGEIAPRLPRAAPAHSITVEADIAEGRIAEGLAAIQQNTQAALGSYPYYRETGPGVQLVARGRDPAVVESAARAIEAMLTELGAAPRRV